MKKTILYLLLAIIACAIVFVLVNSSSGKKEEKKAETGIAGRNSVSSTEANSITENEDNLANESEETTNDVDNSEETTNEKKVTVDTSDVGWSNPNIVNRVPVIKENLASGTVYKVTEEDINPDIVVGDNYYDTQIADMSTNFDQYEGKTIEIEGMYLTSSPYTYVGRYSLSNLCPTCPAGYAYYEYEWKGDEVIPIKEEDDWIKVIGTLRKGNDGQDYYYIDVASIEVMNEKGQTTVTN